MNKKFVYQVGNNKKVSLQNVASVAHNNFLHSCCITFDTDVLSWLVRSYRGCRANIFQLSPPFSDKLRSIHATTIHHYQLAANFGEWEDMF